MPMVFQTGIPYRTGRYDQDPDRLEVVSQRLGVASMIDVSLDVNGERRGVLQADSRHPDYFTARDLDFLFAVSGWIGIVTHRGELFERVTRDAEQRGRRQAGDERRRIIRREREVVVLLAQGFTNDQIAERLVLERGTVGNHVAHILRTLGISRRAQIAVWAVYSGLYDLQTAWISALTQVTSGTGRKVPGRSQ
jgi:DNA-binding CsgD family transcriptional regulator